MKDFLDNLTFVIPARLGSSRIKEKVLLPFPFNSEKNLITHKVDAIRRYLPSAKIILSCGEEKLFDIADDLGLLKSIRTGKHINGHEVGTREAICEVIKDVTTEFVAWTPVVTPLHDHVIIQKSLEKFYAGLNRNEFDSLTTGVRIYEYLWQNGQPLNYHADERHPDSQFLPELYRLSNGIYICSKKIMHERGYFLGHKPHILPIPKICAFDIDEQEDYDLACGASQWYEKVRDEFYST